MSRGKGTIAALCAAALLALGGAGAAAADTAVTADVGAAVAGLWPGPDGASWGYEYDPLGPRLVRVGSSGVLARADIPAGRRLDLARWQPLALPDGAVGLFLPAASWTGHNLRAPALVRLDPASGLATRVTGLPAVAANAYGVTVAPDGAVWFARSCEDELGRIAPGSGRVSYVHLPARGCGSHASSDEPGAALAFDPRGSLWLVNLCMGRIDRVSRAGAVREWRPPRITCDDFYGVTTTIAVDPAGGIAYAARGGFGAGSGRVRDDRRERFPSFGAGLFTGDGALWRKVLRGVERRDADGSRAVFDLPRGLTQVSDLAPSRTGGVALVAASYWRSYGGDSHNLPTPAYLGPRVVSVGADGTQRSSTLAEGGTDAPWQLSDAELSLASDGAVFVREQLVSPDGLDYSGRLLWVSSDALDSPKASIARVRAILGRVGRTVWLQLSCDADPGRYCVGTARLGGASIAHPARFAIAGQMPGAVPVRLDWRGVRTLIRRGELRAPAIVTSAGAQTRRSVRISR